MNTLLIFLGVVLVFLVSYCDTCKRRIKILQIQNQILENEKIILTEQIKKKDFLIESSCDIIKKASNFIDRVSATNDSLTKEIESLKKQISDMETKEGE